MVSIRCFRPFRAPPGPSYPTERDAAPFCTRPSTLLISSFAEFYPYLQDYYEAFVEEWLSERGLLEDPAGSGYGSASGREAC